MRPVRVHVRTGAQEDGQSTFAISVPRQFAEEMGDGHYAPELLPGGTLVFRPMVPVYEPVPSLLEGSNEDK